MKAVTARGVQNLYLLVCCACEIREVIVSTSTRTPEFRLGRRSRPSLHRSDGGSGRKAVDRDARPGHEVHQGIRGHAEGQGREDECLACRQSKFERPLRAIRSSIKYECLYKFIIFGRRHLDHHRGEWVEYYNTRRSHMERDHLPPIREAPDEVPTLDRDQIVVQSYVGGLVRSFERLRGLNEMGMGCESWIAGALCYQPRRWERQHSPVSVRPPKTNRRPRILVRSSWQTVNIGDIAHTPGLLALLERHFPEAEVRLWPSRIDHGVDALLQKRFPKLTIIQRDAELKSAFDECEFLLHGSGASLVAERDVARWSTETGKPYGVYGITLPRTSSTATQPARPEVFQKTIERLSQAKFVFFRDSVSLQLAKDSGCRCPVMEFGPDAAFGTDLRNDEPALRFLQQHGLVEGKFLCCIPRLRYTPYWLIPEKNTPRDETKHARNEAMKEHDHEPLRQAIAKVVRETDLKVLICPEDRTQMAVGKELLYDRLPNDVQRRTVWREDYWLTGEALSTYIRSAGLFGNEMHSPILCIGNGIPAIVCRWVEQTSKGMMWRDIGLGDWLFDFDNEERRRASSRSGARDGQRSQVCPD